MNYNNRYRRYKMVSVKLNDEKKSLVRALIANMIIDDNQSARGIVSRVTEQGKYQLMPEFLDENMDFERLAVRVINKLAEEQITAIREVVEERLLMEYEDAHDRLSRLLAMRTTPPDVITMSFALVDWIEQQRMLAAVKEAVKIIAADDMSTRDAYTEISRILTEVAPRDTTVEINDDEALATQWGLVQELRDVNYHNGKGLEGPTYPWPSLRKKITCAKKGDMHTWLAKSKHGKTVVGVLLAEHMAYNCPGYDVAYFHLETSPMSIEDRIMSRHMRVQTGAMRVPEVFRIKEKKYQDEYQRVKKLISDGQKNGKITYVHCPGINFQELQSKIAEQNALSQARGRELVVIIDYYTEIDWTNLADNETAGNNILATKLKNMAGTEGIYLICFAQFNIDTEYGKKRTAWNGSKIVMRSQAVIRVEREDEAEFDEPILIQGKDGKDIQKKDLLGVPMFWHTKGQANANAVFNILFANDDEPGPVKMKFINAYFDVVDVEADTDTVSFNE